MKRFSLICLCLALVLLLMPGCSSSGLKRYSAEFVELFDTFTQIIGYANSKAEFTAHAEEIYNQLKAFHQLYDIYNNYNDINNLKTINDNAGIMPVKVDAKIIDLLLYAKEIYTLTNEKCNIAMGSVLSIWHDYRTDGINDPENAKLPPTSELIDASAHTDIDKIIIDTENSTVYLDDPFMRIDVGAVAKGYATEIVALAMTEKGVDHMLLSVGGNIRAIGGKPPEADQDESPPWKVGIRDPFDDNKGNIVSLKINNKSVVTSGDYERYYIVDGEKQHHIIDPNTLMHAPYFTSVTIECPHSGLADSLSTAIFCMDYEEGRALIESLEDVEAMWLMHDQTMVYTDGFEDMILP